MKNQNMKVTKDGFIWLDVSEKAKEVWSSGLFSLFALYEDDTESMIENSEMLHKALADGLEIGIEVGHMPKTSPAVLAVFTQAIKDIERWRGEGYLGPCKECPDGDEIYLAVESIKKAIDIPHEKEYKYSIPAPVLWCSFDYGSVIAEDEEEARAKARIEIERNFTNANSAFEHCDNTKDFSINFDPSAIVIEEVKK